MSTLRPALTFGIEEEFLLVDLSSRDVPARPPPGLVETCRQAFGLRLAEEMFQSQIELVSPILQDLAAARRCLLDGRQRLAAIAADFGLGVLGAAAHPFADWRQQQPTDSPHYRQLFADYREIAQRSLLSGLHVHVGVPPERDRLRTMNRLLGWLPLLLALSASSPFWGGRDTGLASYRRALCGEWPRMGIPEHLPDEAAFAAYVDLLLAAGAVRKRGDVWWFVRPSARFPTLELRIADACPRVEDALCIAGLFRALVNWALEAQDTADAGLQRMVLEENYWRARRQGCRACFLDARGRGELSAGDWLEQLQRLIDDGTTEESFARARWILREGNSAERQRRIHTRALEAGLSRQAALEAVVDSLLEETAARSAGSGPDPA